VNQETEILNRRAINGHVILSSRRLRMYALRLRKSRKEIG